MDKIYIYDTTLRDGAKGEGALFSVDDKIKVVKRLDDLGVDYIDIGSLQSNYEDLDFFTRASQLILKNAKLCAFGEAHHIAGSVQEDGNIISLIDESLPVVSISAKAWDLYVTKILKTEIDSNLKSIVDTITYFKNNNKEIIFEAEHFFDGYKNNPDYALELISAAERAGANWIVLCDTKGGSLPDEVSEIMKIVNNTVKVKVGINCYNDAGMASANSVMAVFSGCKMVKGTINGIGGRCGNANLCTIIPNLQIKREYNCIPEEKLYNLTKTSRFISELANISHDEWQPYVGLSAFAHKEYTHNYAECDSANIFEHINPAIIGSKSRFLKSEIAEESNIIRLIQEIDPTIEKNSPAVQNVIEKLKIMEHQGLKLESTESSIELLIQKELGLYNPFFKLEQLRVFVDAPAISDNYRSTAMIKVIVDGKVEITAEQGNGAVNAMDKALRKALERFYPQLKGIHLTDYKVRVLDSKDATAAKVRVFIETTDGESTWTTIGVSTDVIDATWKALVESIEYKLLSDRKTGFFNM